MTVAHAARVTVTLAADTTLGAGPRGDNRIATLDHVPGSVLRGALAAEWIRRLGPPQPGSAHRGAFLSAFEGTGSFAALRPEPGLVVPLSVWRHKYRPRPSCSRLWWDRAEGADDTICPDCRGGLVPSDGTWRSFPAGGRPPGDVTDTVTRTHTALDDDGVATAGALFTRSALPAGLRLSGYVAGDAVDALHIDGTPVTTLRLGARRSVAGAAALEIEHDTEPAPVPWQEGRLVLRLDSPAVFLDAYGLPAAVPDHPRLERALGTALPTPEAFVRWEEHAGWHAASGLPKPAERTVAAGSTWIYRVDRDPGPDARRRLAVAGLGIRRIEGFGAVCTRSFTPAPPTLIARIDVLRTWTQLLPPLTRRDPVSGDGTDPSLQRLASSPGFPGQPGLRALLDLRDPAGYTGALHYLRTGTPLT